MGLHAAVQALKKADRLKEKVINCEDLLNDNEAWHCQQQLQEIYQQVLILDLEYALDKKVEQELWSHGFKKYIATLQTLAKDEKNPKRSESQALLSSCLDGASGFYLTLLQEVCTTFDLDLPFRRRDVTHSTKRNTQLSKPQRTSCYYICQHCLVHLGDIARYRNHSRQAEAFYRHAVQLSPLSGQPYNQLALLESSRGDRLSTVFHYMRSIAVRHMFPAASSNLALTLEKCASYKWNKDYLTTKLTTTEYLSLYLKLHAYFYTCRELDVCASYVKTLTDALIPHIATQSFNSWKLVQIFAINTFAYYHPCRDGEDQAELTADEVRMRSYVVDLIAGSLNAFLLPVYTLKQDETLLDYFALPVVKLTLEWVRLQPQVLLEEGFTKRLQIWPSLSRLLNVLQASLSGFSAQTYAKVPLPEDSDLQGFIPLEKAFMDLNFSLQEGSVTSNKLRGARLLQLGNWLAQNTPNLITSNVVPLTLLLGDGKQRPSQQLPHPEPLSLHNPSIDILSTLDTVQDILSTLDTPCKVSTFSVVPPHSTLLGDGKQPEPAIPHLSHYSLHNPSIDILSTLDTVQEKTVQAILNTSAADFQNDGSNVNRTDPARTLPCKPYYAESQEQDNQKQATPYPPVFPFPPPTIDKQELPQAPPPPARGTPLADEPRNPIPWWKPPRGKPLIMGPPHLRDFRALPFGLNQSQVIQQTPSNDIFGNNMSYKNPFSTMFSQPPPPTFNSQQHPEPAKSQVVESPQPSNLVSPAYSLFSPAWTAPQHPPPPVASLMGQQSLWFGPGPSPLERLLEQQKQLRKGPTPHSDAT
ncbi:protein SMG7-like [Homalodisca vitripennis]|uniref:protein SMG7-like n=1 Tax=Homalodisca vitripennis TaxID=197043 RepID=UPI001EEC4824|nr:protein SMG7-like [Homalodisca vitripennis]